MSAGVDAEKELCEAVARVEELLGERATRDAPLGPRTTYRVGGPRSRARRGEGRGRSRSGRRGAATRPGSTSSSSAKARTCSSRTPGFPASPSCSADGFGAVEIDAEGLVVAGGAVALPVLARTTAHEGWAGLEWAVGVPGTVGGGVRMNAGGHGSATAERLVSARLVSLRDGGARVVPSGDLDLSYRHSSVGPDDVVTEASFRLDRGDPKAAAVKIAEIVAWRRANQPGGRNAGSIFQNPAGDSAGRLVEAAGAKALRIGSAEVSNKHANFIQADDGGSADDVRALIEAVREAVRRKTGVALVTEVVFVGFDR